MIFLINLKIDFWRDLVPSWPNLAPQTFPKWIQVGSQIDPSWGVDLTHVLEGIFAQLLWIFNYNMTWPRLQKLDKLFILFAILVVGLLG